MLGVQVALGAARVKQPARCTATVGLAVEPPAGTPLRPRRRFGRPLLLREPGRQGDLTLGPCRAPHAVPFLFLQWGCREAGGRAAWA